MAKRRASVKKAGPRPWYLRWHFWLAVVAVVGIVFWRLWPTPSPEAIPENDTPRAAIVDQLYAFGYENPSLINELTHSLEGAGFKVDLYQGTDATTVSTYKKILASNYSVVIFRAHSGLIRAEGEPMQTSIFTSEPFSVGPFSCSSDVASGALVKARVSEGDPFYFAITSDFVRHYMSAMKNSLVLLSGCSGLYSTDLAQAFMSRGASVYLGWDGSVGPEYVDRATAVFISTLCRDGVSLDEAVNETMRQVGEDPQWHSELKYFPAIEEIGSQTLPELCKLYSPAQYTYGP